MTDLDDTPKVNIDMPSFTQTPRWLGIITTIRWTLFFPIAVMAFFLVFSAMVIIGHDWHPGILQNVGAFCSCFAFVAIGGWLAPAYRHRVAIVLVGLLTLVLATLWIVGSLAISGNTGFFAFFGAMAAAGKVHE